MTLAVCVPVPGEVSETFIRRHVEELAPGDTVVLARRPADAATWEIDGPVLYLDRLDAAWAGPEEQEATAGFLDAHGVRAVLAEFLDVWVDLLDALRGQGRRVVAHAHGYDATSRLREPFWRERYAAWGEADAVVTMSHTSRRRLLGAVRLPAQLVHVVPYGVDIPPQRRPPAPAPTVECLAVGRLVPKKAPHLTLSAFARAAAADERLRLTIVGRGPLRATVEQQLRDSGLAGRVQLRGAQPNEEVHALMDCADIFLQHSVTDRETGDEEGLPVAILEAMAHGLPVIATRHAAIPEAIETGRSGLMVEEGDVGGMAAEILRLAADPTRRAAIGAAARAEVAARFSPATERAALRTLLQL